MTKLLAENGINLRAVSVADTADFGILRLIADRPQDVAAVLAANNVTATLTEVISVPLGDRPGDLAKKLAVLSENGVAVEYLYAYLSAGSDGAVVVMRVDDTAKAEKLIG